MTLPGLPWTIAEAARRFGDRTAYVTRRGWSLVVRRRRPHLRRGRGRARGARASARATSSRSCCRPGPSTCSRTARAAKLGAITAGVNDRLSRARARPRCSTSPSPTLVDRRRRPAGRRAPTTCCTDLRVARRSAARRSPTTPTGRSRSSSRRARPGCPKGALYCNRQLAFITQTDVGDTWDGGGRSFSGTSFAHLGFMTKLPGQPAARRHDLHHGALARAPTRSSCSRASSMTTVAGVPTQLALMLRDPTSTPSTSSSRAVHRRRRRPGHARARRRSAPPLRRAARDALLVHRGRHRARHRVRRSRRGRDRERRPPAPERRPRGPRRRRRAGARGRDRRGVPALPRGHVRLLARSRADRAPRSPPTASCAPATSAGSTTAAACASSAAARRCTCAAATTCIPVEVEGVLSTHPDVAAVAVVPRADAVMGEIGVAVVVPRDADAPADARRAPRLRRRRSSRRTSCRRRCTSSTRCRSPRARRSTGARSPRSSSAQPDAPVSSRRRGHGARFTADQDELRDAIRAVLAKESPVALAARGRRDRRRARPRSGRRWSSSAGRRSRSPKRDGGIGLGVVEAGDPRRGARPGDRARSAARRPSRSSCPAVREAGTAEQQRPLPRRGRGRRARRHARDRRSERLVRSGRRRRDRRRSTATTLVLRGREALRDRRRRGRRARRRRARAPAPPATTASRAVVVPVARRRRHPGHALRRQPPARARRRSTACASTRDRVLGDAGASATPARCAARSRRRRSRSRSRWSAPRRRSSTSRSTTRSSASSSACRSARSRRSSTSSPT